MLVGFEDYGDGRGWRWLGVDRAPREEGFSRRAEGGSIILQSDFVCVSSAECCMSVDTPPGFRVSLFVYAECLQEEKMREREREVFRYAPTPEPSLVKISIISPKIHKL